jgi:Tol biopolymer transport system component
MKDLLGGKLPAGEPLLHASSNVMALTSPDGKRLLIRRSVPGPDGRDELRLSVAPFGPSVGSETPVPATGLVKGATWSDSVNVNVYSLTPHGSRITRTDVRTGAANTTLDIQDSVIVNPISLGSGWAWIPKARDRVIIEQDGKRREINKPAWAAELFQIDVSRDGSRLAMLGWNATTGDTVGVFVVPVAGGTPTQWTRSFAEQGGMAWLDDGSLAFTAWSGSDAATIYRVSGPGQQTTVGAIPHVANALTISRDFARATIGWRDYRGDAWMYRVVRP